MIYISPVRSGHNFNYQYPQFYRLQTNTNDYSMSINGKGSVMVEPDIATVSLGVETENKELKVAQEENAVKSTQVLNSLKNNGIAEKDVKTEAYTINLEYDYIEGKQVFRGYKVTHTFKVTIKDLKRVGEIIDDAVASGANVVNNVNFTVSNPSIYYRQALNLAIEDAIKKAKIIEGQLEIVVNKVPINIIEEGQSSIPIPITKIALYSAPIAHTPIKEGQIEINASIKAVFVYWTKAQ